MDTFQPLTPEQYSAARSKFSPDQIIEFEKQRKAQASSATPTNPTNPTTPTTPAGGDIGMFGKLALGPAVGALKGIASTAKGLSNLGETVASQTVGRLGNWFKGNGFKATTPQDSFTNAVGGQANSDAITTPQGAGENVGYYGEKIAQVLTPGGAAEGLVPTIASGALTGGISSAVDAASNDKSTAGDITKAGLTGAAAGAATGGLSYGFGKLLEGAGSKIFNTIIKPSQADIKDGFNIDTVKKYDLGGSLSKMYEKTESKLNELSTQLRAKLSSSDSSIDMNKVYEDTVSSLSKDKLKSFGSNTSVDGVVEQLKNEIAHVNPSGTMSIPDAQVVKQASGRMGAWQFGTNDPNATARETVYNAFYRNLKEAIEKESPEGVKEINKQIGELIPISNAVIRRIPVASRNSAISLNDMVGLVGSIIDPKAAISLGLSFAQKSGTAGNVLTKVAPSIINQASKIGGASGYGFSKLVPTK